MSTLRAASIALFLLCLSGGAVRADDCEDLDNEPCNTGELGRCAEGRYDCDDGELRCERRHDPRTEDCGNGEDDDCDGLTDGMDPSCRCDDRDNDGWAVCSSSCQPATGDQCGDCDDGRSDVNPNRAEVCNGRDDDCDGSQDEANPGGGTACQTGQSGICGAGTMRCVSGSLRCESNLAAREEDCDNGLDDDCDGSADQADSSCTSDCGPSTDSDGDRLADCADNCPQLSNPNQQDYDGDGLGDACETGVRLCDVDRSGRVDGVDLALLGKVFGRRCSDAGFDRRVDLNRDCSIDGDDLALLASVFGSS